MIKYFLSIHFFALLLLNVTQLNAQTEKLTVRADDWCPFTCSKQNSTGNGVLVDILTEATKGVYQIDYNLMNWPRAIDTARKGKIDAILGAYKEDAPDFIFPKNYQIKSQDCFYSLKDSNWKYSKIDDLKGVKIAINSGYSYGDELDNLIKLDQDSKTFSVSSGDDLLTQNMNKTKSKRVTAFIENKLVFNYNQMNSQLNLFKESGCLTEKEIYIAFSPDKNQKLKSQKTADLVEKFMKNKKALDLIYKKYHLK